MRQWWREIRDGGVIGEGKIIYDIKLSSEGFFHQMLGALRPVVTRHLQRQGHICHRSGIGTDV